MRSEVKKCASLLVTMAPKRKLTLGGKSLPTCKGGNIAECVGGRKYRDGEVCEKARKLGAVSQRSPGLAAWIRRFPLVTVETGMTPTNA